MFKGEFKFDLHDALMARGQQYCRAYHTTNEPITEWLSLTPVKNPRVLTVAASGDQPLMYAGAGAAHIDTFDITVNACAVMDFKTTALQQKLNLSEYQDAVQTLIKLDQLETMGTRQLSAFMRIVDNMPLRTRPILQSIIRTNFNLDAFSQHTIKKLKLPTDEAQFAKMQKSVHAPFNFIWSDLVNVHHYIDGEYDIINLSNIFDHYLWYKNSPKSVFDSIKSLWPHLRPGGYMLCTSTAPDNLETIQLIAKLLPQSDISITHQNTEPPEFRLCTQSYFRKQDAVASKMPDENTWEILRDKQYGRARFMICRRR